MSYATQLIERFSNALRPAKAAPVPPKAPATTHGDEAVAEPVEEAPPVEASVAHEIAGD